MKNPFGCLSCSKTDNNTTTFTIKSSCFNKPIKISILNDDKKYEMLHQLIWALAGDEEKKQIEKSLNNSVNSTSPVAVEEVEMV